jgi:hypothetical protein
MMSKVNELPKPIPNDELIEQLWAIQHWIQPMSPHEGFTIATAHTRIRQLTEHLQKLVDAGCDGDCDECHYCGVILYGDTAKIRHEADCAYMATKAFLGELNATRSMEKPDGH